MRKAKNSSWVLNIGRSVSNTEQPGVLSNPEDLKLAEEQQQVWNLLDAWVAPPVSPRFNAQLYARIEALKQRPWHLRGFDSVCLAFSKPVVALSLATVLVLAGVALDQSFLTHRHHPTLASPRVTAVDADQLENGLDDLQWIRQVYAEPGTQLRSM